MAKIFDNIGVTQGRMVPSEKKRKNTILSN